MESNPKISDLLAKRRRHMLSAPHELLTIGTIERRSSLWLLQEQNNLDQQPTVQTLIGTQG